MTNNEKILGYIGLARKAGKIFFGSQSCEDAILRKKIKLIIVAEDAADRTKRNFEMLCSNNHIPFETFGKIIEISKCIGQNNKAIIGIKDKNLADAILKIINGGEFIGESKNA